MQPACLPDLPDLPACLLAAGDSGPVVLLIHGFGASVYHWRYNVPELSKHARVYAIDCLGGWPTRLGGCRRLAGKQRRDEIHHHQSNP